MPVKYLHEIRDPIHNFIKLNADERKVLDSRPMQRLRQIHQLALTYLLYPGATHSRFEHSLGVMELASRVFDVITDPPNVTDGIRTVMRTIGDPDELVYWRRVLRMAALCHDLGHPPFSHAAEKKLFPSGWNHERLSRDIILSDEMKEVWESLTIPLRPAHIVKLAIGRPRKAKEWAKDLTFSNWEAILSEILVSDAFGTDRMDYLLRDSHYAGVAYGKFDHHRLIDTLRVLPSLPDVEESEPVLGVEEGGLHAAEALLLARYFMYTQIYLHHIRLIYDTHLIDFLSNWLDGGQLPTTDLPSVLALTDNEVTAAILKACRDETDANHGTAVRILSRKHYRLLYERRPGDLQKNPEPGLAVFEAAKLRFNEDNVRYQVGEDAGGSVLFPVQTKLGRYSSVAISTVLEKLPAIKTEYVYINPDNREEAEPWLKENLDNILSKRGEGDQ